MTTYRAELKQACKDAGACDLTISEHDPNRSLSRTHFVAECWLRQRRGGVRLQAESSDHDGRGWERAVERLLTKLRAVPPQERPLALTRSDDPPHVKPVGGRCQQIAKESLYHRLLHTLRYRGPQSARWCEFNLHGHDRSTWYQRLRELADRGLVVHDGFENDTGSRRTKVWAITTDGDLALKHVEHQGTWTPPELQETP